MPPAAPFQGFGGANSDLKGRAQGWSLFQCGIPQTLTHSDSLQWKGAGISRGQGQGPQQIALVSAGSWAFMKVKVAERSDVLKMEGLVRQASAI